MVKGIKIFFAFIIAFSYLLYKCPQETVAYDGPVHMEINKHAINESNLDDFLKNGLGFSTGIKQIINKQEIRWWIEQGGEAEDYGKKGKDDYLTTRAFNHFHDPLKDWDNAGLHNDLNVLYTLFYRRLPVSALIWGLNPGEQNFEENKQYPDLQRRGASDWSWGKARDYYYYQALTSQTQDERDQNFADCFRSLGQVMHLIQDMSVPLHTRNDVHVFPNRYFTRWPREFTYETYVSKEYMKKYFKNLLPISPNSRLLEVPAVILDPNYTDLVPVSGLFDRNAYNDTGPIPPSSILGLAEYSNANFLTLDTMWSYPHPNLDDVASESIDWLHPEDVVGENGKTYKRVYLKLKDGVGEDIRHLAAVDYFTREYMANITVVKTSGFTLDHVCWKDYADKLIPRAVGYSAALLDYFFRGAIKITNLNLQFSSYTAGFDGVTLSAQNTSTFPENEEMSGGSVHLVVKYKLDGGDQFQYIVKQLEGEKHLIPRQTATSFDFDLSASPIPLAAKDVSLYLVYKGQLGLETGAVAVGYTPIPLEITPPERFVYSIIDGSVTPQQFTYIKAKVMNTNAELVIGEGALKAMAIYRRRTDYKADLSADPPTAASREAYFSRSESSKIDVTSLSSQEAVEFEFDFTNNPIPVDITDLYLQVEFRGTINGRPASVALGIKDISEPMHISVSNSTDRFYLHHVLKTSAEIKANPDLVSKVDSNEDGVLNQQGEPYIDPFDLSIGVALYPSDSTPPDPEDYSAIYFDMPPGAYGKIIMLTDTGEFNLLLHYEYTLPYVFMIERFAVSLSGVINQQDADGTFHNTQVYTLRGLIQHNHFLYARAHPDNAGIYSASWPEFENDPVPISTLRP
ncbi:MAG: hypothetical protein JRJ03_12570 [Deltaproteobacteria bacterium]|nr:hypothetical protein [Deltaproteobacteria bacterium]